MGAVDITAQVRAWALAEVEQQCFGDDFGVDAGWDAIPTQAGVQVGYRLVISCRSPLLGQGPLFSLAPMLTPQPTAELVREAVTTLLRNLRELSAAQLKAPARAG
jgi:hypothetical protein